jgi:hypothetical protein
MLSSGWLRAFGKNKTFCWKVGIHLLDETASRHRRPVLMQTDTRLYNFIFVITDRYKLRLFHTELGGMSFNYLFLFLPLLPMHCRWWEFFVTLVSNDTHSIGIPWTKDRPETGISTYTTQTIHKGEISMSLEGFEPAIPASEQPQTYDLACAASGIG